MKKEERKWLQYCGFYLPRALDIELLRSAKPLLHERRRENHLAAMRIRKHFHLSSLLSGAGDSPRPPSRICRLNQSPWDVFDSPPSPPPQLDDRDDIFAAAAAAAAHGGTSANSVTATHSVTNTKMFKDEEANYFNSESESDAEEEEERVTCAKSDGKKWRCKSVAAKGNLLCQHHLELLRNYQTSAHHPSNKKKKMMKKKIEKEEQGDVANLVSKGSRRVRARKMPMSSNPYEFYYYSGFGRSWGKTRGARKKDVLVVAEEEVFAEQDDSHSPSTSSSDVHEIDGIVHTEDDEEEKESGGIRKRRARKPIKARSLKSLM